MYTVIEQTDEAGRQTIWCIYTETVNSLKMNRNGPGGQGEMEVKAQEKKGSGGKNTTQKKYKSEPNKGLTI